MADWTERLNRFIDSLQADRRPERNLASSREELDDLRMAARLAGSRPESPSPNPEFLSRLRAELSVAPGPVSRRFSRAYLLRAAGIWVAGLASGIGIDVAGRYF